MNDDIEKPFDGDTEDQRETSYVLFPGHTEGMRLYTELRSIGITGRIAPTPRQARSSCGISVLIDRADKQAVEEMIRTTGVGIEGIVDLTIRGEPNPHRFC